MLLEPAAAPYRGPVSAGAGDVREPLRGEVPRGGGQVPLPERADQSAVPEGGCPGPDRLPQPSCSCRPAGAQAPQLSQARGGGGRWPGTRSLLTPITALCGQHLPAPGGGGWARGRVGEERGAHAGRPVSWERWHRAPGVARSSRHFRPRPLHPPSCTFSPAVSPAVLGDHPRVRCVASSGMQSLLAPAARSGQTLLVQGSARPDHSGFRCSRESRVSPSHCSSA